VSGWTFWTCNDWRLTGACDNAVFVPLPTLDHAVLGALRDDVLSPGVIEATVSRAVEIYQQEPDVDEERRQRLEA
jgi:hypothetical protein